MRRSLAAGLLAVGLALVAWGQLQAGLQRMRAHEIVFSVQQLAQAVARGEVPAHLLRGAVGRLREARELDPGSIEVVASQGDLFLLLERYEAARDAYLEALELEPRAEVYLNLAIAQAELGHRREARRNLRRAMRLDRSLRPAARSLQEKLGSDPA